MGETMLDVNIKTVVGQSFALLAGMVLGTAIGCGIAWLIWWGLS